VLPLPTFIEPTAAPALEVELAVACVELAVDTPSATAPPAVLLAPPFERITPLLGSLRMPLLIVWFRDTIVLLPIETPLPTTGAAVKDMLVTSGAVWFASEELLPVTMTGRFAIEAVDIADTFAPLIGSPSV